MPISTPEQRQQALVLHRSLMRVQKAADGGEGGRAKKLHRDRRSQVIAAEPGAGWITSRSSIPILWIR